MTIAAADRLPSQRLLRSLALPSAFATAFAVSVGYIDPGNWATDFVAGQYGTRLLWAVTWSGLAAILLQILAAWTASRTGRDLASTIRDSWPKLRLPALLGFAGAAMATDVAEFAGIVAGVQLLFHLPRLIGVGVGLVIVIALFVWTGRTRSRFERLMGGAVAFVAGASALACVKLGLHFPPMLLAHDAVVPSIPDAIAGIAVVAIFGATIMPHNLLLHSSLAASPGDARRASRGHAVATTIALGIATILNAAILIVGIRLHANGTIDGARDALVRIAGGGAGTIFAAVFLCTGIAAALGATRVGDIVVATLARRPFSSTMRRCLTLAPAAVVLAAGIPIAPLLVWSQVALGVTLPVVVVPLLCVAADLARRELSPRAIGFVIVTSIVATGCVALSTVSLVQTVLVR